MDGRTRKEIQNSRNVLIQSNDPSFNYAFLKGDDLQQFHQLPEVVGLNRYDYSFKRDDGTDMKLPSLTPTSLLMSKNNLEATEEWYRQKYPNLPDEYHGIMARYSTGQLLTKKQIKQEIKKSEKKNRELPVGLQIAHGKFCLEWD
tara:strand:- start:205 stop:639 length:435 start_codon:yes stop_codon:yes gene_type:complete